MTTKNLDLLNRNERKFPSNGPVELIMDPKEIMDKLTGYVLLDFSNWWNIPSGKIIKYVKTDNLQFLMGGIMKNVGTDRMTKERFFYIIPINKVGWKGKVFFKNLGNVWVRQEDYNKIIRPTQQPQPIQSSQPSSSPNLLDIIPSQEINLPQPQQPISTELEQTIKLQKNYIQTLATRIEENKQNNLKLVTYIKQMEEEVTKNQRALVKLLTIITHNNLKIPQMRSR